MRKKLLVFMNAVFLSYACVFSQDDARMSIAVSDLKGVGMDQTTATASLIFISDWLREDFISTGAFRVMKQAETESILTMQGFQQSGACDEPSCLQKMGRLLGVDRVAAGSISKAGTVWTVSVYLLNVATAEKLFTVNEGYEGDISGIVPQVTAKVAALIASFARQEVKNATVVEKKSDLNIELPQAGATAEIQEIAGAVVKSVTPLTLPTYEGVRGSLSVVPTEPARATNNDLIQPKAFLGSTVKKAPKKKHWGRIISFGVAAAGSLGSGIFFNVKAQQHIGNLNKVQADYSEAATGFDKYQTAYSKEKDKLKGEIVLRNIFYGLAGACGSVCAISIRF